MTKEVCPSKINTRFKGTGLSKRRPICVAKLALLHTYARRAIYRDKIKKGSPSTT